jgi:hypothetical protein
MFKIKYRFVINRKNYITIQIKKWWWNRWRTIFYIDRDIHNIDATTEIPTEVYIDIKKDLKSVKFNCVKDAEKFIEDLKQKSNKEKDYYYYKLGKIIAL